MKENARKNVIHDELFFKDGSRTRKKRNGRRIRTQINTKIVIQICRNDFHPESIRKVPWESPSSTGCATPVASRIHHRTTRIQCYFSPLRRTRPSVGGQATRPSLSHLICQGLTYLETYYFLNLQLNTHISALYRTNVQMAIYRDSIRSIILSLFTSQYAPPPPLLFKSTRVF